MITLPQTAECWDYNMSPHAWLTFLRGIFIIKSDIFYSNDNTFNLAFSFVLSLNIAMGSIKTIGFKCTKYFDGVDPHKLPINTPFSLSSALILPPAFKPCI